MEHETIESLKLKVQALEETNKDLKRKCDGMKIARDDHFRNTQQLASRCTQLKQMLEDQKKASEKRFYDLIKPIAIKIQMAMFDPRHCSFEEAVRAIAHSPAMPWASGPWDVTTKSYANMFYKTFPKAKVTVNGVHHDR